MSALQAGGMDCPCEQVFLEFWDLQGLPRQEALEKSATGQIGSGSLASLVSASPPGWE